MFLQESLQCYVQKLSEDLSESLDRSPLARCNRGSSPPERRSQSEEMEFGVMGQRLPGSVGHPELCRRPCIYFMAGEGLKGRACGGRKILLFSRQDAVKGME